MFYLSTKKAHWKYNVKKQFEPLKSNKKTFMISFMVLILENKPTNTIIQLLKPV